MDCEDKVETFTTEDYIEIDKKEKKQPAQNKITVPNIFTKKIKREKNNVALEQNVYPLKAL